MQDPGPQLGRVHCLKGTNCPPVMEYLLLSAIKGAVAITISYLCLKLSHAEYLSQPQWNENNSTLLITGGVSNMDVYTFDSCPCYIHQ